MLLLAVKKVEKSIKNFVDIETPTFVELPKSFLGLLLPLNSH